MDAMDARVAESFGRQRVMGLLRARLRAVERRRVEIELAFREELTQQDGFLHAGVVTMIADSAAGYAALTEMDEGSRVLSVEFKVNLLAPAKGELFVATGMVVRAGRTLTVVQSEAEAWEGEGRKVVAVMQGTMMRVEGRRDQR